MRGYKRILSAVLCLALIFMLCFLPFTAFGVSIKSGTDDLRKHFKRGEGPGVGNLSIDYSYYSPMRSGSDRTTYPLVVILAGQGEHKNKGDELKMNEFCTWSADEYQKRFATSGGAYIMLARAREEKNLSWNASSLVEPLAAAVKDFAERNKNVDRQRIYVFGWSYGGIASLRVAAYNPNLFAAVISSSPPFILAQESAEKLKNTAVWMILSKDDTIAPYETMTRPTWERIKSASNNPEKLRLTTYDDAPNTEHILNHNSWFELINDFDVHKEGYTGRKTVDGNENTVNEKGAMLSWLSRQTLYTPENAHRFYGEKCDCVCQSENKIAKYLWHFGVYFWAKFEEEKYRYCKCGARHW